MGAGLGANADQAADSPLCGPSALEVVAAGGRSRGCFLVNCSF